MVPDQVRTAVARPLAELGLLVEDVTVTPAGRRTVVRIAVDRDLEALALPDDTTPVAPLSLDEVAVATRAVEAALEPDEVSGSAAFVLEVSSPGVDRPLTQRRQLRRNVGRLVDLRTLDGVRLTGRILAVSADELLLDASPTPVRVPVAQVRAARVQVEFGHLPADEESA